MKVLSGLETARLLPYASLVPAIARAAAEQARGQLAVPERLVVPCGENQSLLCMPAIGPDIGINKRITVHAGGGVGGLPAIQGEVVVFETATGRPRLVLDGPEVTARRTAAVTLLAIEKLSGRKPRSAVLVGTGAQARAHARGLIEYFGMTRIRMAGRNESHAEGFAARLRAEQAGIDAQAVRLSELEGVAAEADVVIALTTSSVPVIPPRLPDSTLAVGVGAFRAHMAELPPQLLRTRRIVVDHLAGARHEAGDLIQAGIDWATVMDLSQVLDGAPMAGEACVFKSVGHAAWDLAAARVALEEGSHPGLQ